VKWFQQKSKLAIGIIFLIAFVWVLRHPVVHYPDSAGYLEMHIIRTPGYPLFLQIIQSIFGEHYEIGVIIIQFLFGCFGIYYFIQKLRLYTIINGFFSVCLAFVLLLPFVTGLKIANNVLTESISYTLYLIIVAKFMSFFISKNKKELYYSLLILALLLITRYQFIYLIPVALGLLFWVSYVEKSLKKQLLLIVLFITLPLMASLIDRTYHKAVHGHFVSTPWTGMNMITLPFFVSDAEDEALFEDATEKQFFQNTHHDLVTSQMNINNFDATVFPTPTQFYIGQFANIAMGPIYKNGVAVLDTSLTENEKFIELNQMTSNMTMPLLWDNFSKWKHIYIQNAIHGFGGFKNLLLYLLIAFYSIYMLWKRKEKIYKVLGLISIVLIANVLIVAIGMHAVIRFTFYNDWVLFLTIFVLLTSLNKKRYES
jgi:O-antigen ligase